jgi:hypothetical protein
MWDALAITEEEAAGLAELAQHDLAMARDFAERARAAEDPDTANELARSYQRMARSYRQTLALKVRLAREIRAAEREAQPPPPPASYCSLYPYDPAAAAIPRDEVRIADRVEELRPAVQRVIWAEYEAVDAEYEPSDTPAGYFFTLLEDRLELYARDNRFGLEPLDDQVVSLCAQMTLSVALARQWRDLPDPPDEAINRPRHDDPEPHWRSSG